MKKLLEWRREICYNSNNEKIGANRMARRRKKSKLGTVITVILILASLLSFAFYYLDTELNLFGRYKPLEDSIEIHVIDVGQGDSILIKTPGGNILIDASTGSAENDLRKYLKSERVKDIEYFFCTHPDEDHIGNADMVVNEFNVKNIVLTDKTSTTQTFQNLINAIKNKGDSINSIKAKVGAKYSVGGLELKILAPLEEYEDPNNASIVLRAQYGKNVAIFTGDAELDSEKAMLKKYSPLELKCDFLKLGHHGSNTSTSEEWLKTTSPTLAAISCGENKYGHPSPEIISRLEKHKVTYYRTDRSGSLVFVSDGLNLVKE